MKPGRNQNYIRYTPLPEQRNCFHRILPCTLGLLFNYNFILTNPILQEYFWRLFQIPTTSDKNIFDSARFI